MTLAPRFLVNFWAGVLAARFRRRLKSAGRGTEAQRSVYAALVARLAATEYGAACGLAAGLSYEQFRARVPLRLTGFFKPWVERMGGGEEDVLWPGGCRFYVETAGTTAAPLHLPVTADMMQHYRTALGSALLLHAARAGHPGVFRGRLLHAGGSTALTSVNNVFLGGLDAMFALCASPWVQANLYAPPAAVAHLPDGAEKYRAIARSMSGCDVTLLGGTPAALLAAIDAVRLAAGPGHPPALQAVWPNLECVVHTGAPLGLFEAELRASLGPAVRLHELYAAAEGVIAAQETDHASDGLRLLTDTGLFFEFLPAAGFSEARLPGLGPQCVPLAEARPGVDYLLVLTTPAGLCRCLPGDVVRFVSVNPPRLVFAGRTQLRLDPGGEGPGEHDLTSALLAVCARNAWTAVNFHVAPYYSRAASGLARGCHEWWVELQPGTVKTPTGPVLAPQLDAELAARHPDYARLREEHRLLAPVVRLVMPGIFDKWSENAGGGTSPSKMPRCRSDRVIADQLATLTRFYSASEVPFAGGHGGAEDYTLLITPDVPAPATAPGHTRNPLQGSRTPFH